VYDECTAAPSADRKGSCQAASNPPPEKRESVEKLIGEIPEDFFPNKTGVKKAAANSADHVKLAS
jgi:hypothetical protein